MIFETLRDEKGVATGVGVKNFSGLFSKKLFAQEDIELLAEYNKGLEKIFNDEQRIAFTEEFLTNQRDNLQQATVDYLGTTKGLSVNLGVYSAKAKLATAATYALNMAINALAIAAVTFIAKEIARAWDEHTLTVEEETAKVEELKGSIKGLQEEYEKLKEKQDLTPEELARLKYLQQRIELEERLFAIEERKRLDSGLGKTQSFLGFTKVDKDSYKYKAGTEFNSIAEGTYGIGDLSDYFKTAEYYRKNADAIIFNRERINKEFLKTQKDNGAHLLEENEKKAEEIYTKLFEKYENFIIEAENIRAELDNPYITETQKKEYQKYLQWYEQGIEETQKTINKLAIEYNNPKWVIKPEFDFDYSDLSIPEVKEKMDEYIQAMATALFGDDENGVYKVKILLGFDIAPANESYDKYADVARVAAEKFGDYTQEYVIGEGYKKSYDFTWADQFAKDNKITTDEQLAFWKKAIEESDTKEEAAQKYLDYQNEYTEKTKGKFSGFTDEQTKQIDEFQSKVDSLGKTLTSLRNGEEINITDLIQEFPELEGHVDDLDDAIVNLVNGSLSDLIDSLRDVLPPEVLQHLIDYRDQIIGIAPSLTETYSRIHSTYDILQQVKEEFDETTGIDKFTDSTLQSIAGINEHMNSLVAAWHANGVSSKELYEELQKQYQTDLENYGKSLVKKYNESTDFYKSVGMLDTNLIKKFNEDYKVDLTGCATYAESKQAIHEQLTKNLSSIWTKFYDENTLELTSMGKSIDDEFNKIASEEDMRKFAASMGQYGETFMAEYSQAKATVNQIKKTEEALNQNIYKGIADAFANNSGSLKNNADSAKSEFDELFDFFERRIELIDQALNKLDASLEEVNGSMAKNILIAGKIGIVQEEIKDYTNALSMYEQKASAELAKLPADLQDKIKNGAVSITRLMGENGEEVNKVLGEYKNWADKVNDCNQKLIELKETLRDLALDKFNNIVQDFTDQFDIIGSSNDLLDKQIAVFEEAGQLIGKAFYESQIVTAQKQKAVLEQEKAALINEMTSSISSGLIQKGTDEWLEMVKSIQEVDSSILDVDQTIEQLQNSLLELNDKVFERLQNTFSDIKSQLSNIVGMVSDVDVSDEKGVWSKEGLTQLGAYAQQYELARHNVEKYEEEIDKLNQADNNGLYSTTEYLDKLSELAEAQWEQANAAEDAKKSILELNKARVELIKEGIQKQIDAYKELIDKQKEALDQEKSIRDYEKTIAEKSKNINKLQNQINLLMNDDSAAANAKRIKLEQELADAMEDLEETQYDHSIEAQKEALDKQMEDFEDARQKEIDELEAYLKEVEKVQADSFEIIKQNTDVIANEIENIAKTHGVIISEAITESWAKGEGAIASYGTALSSASSGFIQQIQTIELYLTALQDEADFTADRLVGMLSAKADNLLNEFNAARDSENDFINATNLLNEALIKTLEGGYDISGIIGSLKAIQDQAEATRKSIDGDNNQDKNKTTTTPKTTTPNTVDDGVARAVSYDTSKTADKTSKGYSNYETENNARAELEEMARNAEKTAEKERKLGYLDNSFKYSSYYNTSTGAWSQKYIELADSAQYSAGAYQLKKTIDEEIDRYKKEREKILQEYAGFATGVHNLSKSQFAWTQEDGHELVLSPTRNAMFTKLNKGDTVLTKEQTDNLFKLSKIDPESIFGNLRVQDYSKSATPVLSIGNIVTVNGNVDDTNIKKIEAVANSAVTKAFKKFSDEIIKR